ncbi:GNAT family N-acetyltransferase [Virgibacillus soli]|uniref:GNAT family N-acetyltransferase n=1 Tax=Paracerasibacillus soli TaxID=480284 RepID=A0ABU5CXS0_9BACI|nr:GNAT family N-acetyltransferase [Virgibacillus soli]MDY0410260.1 GNAT family N-acetyltransferase [Virgibacillus soli]
MKIRRLRHDEHAPMNLLLLADPSSEKVNDYLRKGTCFVAENNKELIGAYVLLSIKPNIIEIMNIAVAEQYQNKGIGKQLVMDAVTKARKYGYEYVEIGTGNSSIGQLALYQKCGFRMVGIDIDYFSRNYVEEIVENGIPCHDMIRLSMKL